MAGHCQQCARHALGRAALGDVATAALYADRPATGDGQGGCASSTVSNTGTING